jgi:DNA ligase-1
MKEIINIINQLEKTSSTNDKINILKQNYNNALLKKVLYYTYSDNLMYGFSEKKLRVLLSDFSLGDTTIYFSDIFSMLDMLSTNNINDKLRYEVLTYLKAKTESERELYIKILTKDLRCNISAKTINKAIPKLIPTWDIQQAYPIDKVKLKKDEWIALSLKLNGIRGTYFKDMFKSRQNKPMLGLDHIIKDIQSIDWLKDFVVDGEMIRKNIDNIPDNENFRLTTSILNSDNNDKSEIGMVIFDLIPIDEFITGQSSKGFKDRLDDLNRLKEDIKNLGLQNISIAPTFYTGTDHSKIEELLDKVDSEGYEGLMCLRNMPYKTKRHNGILKVKKFKTCDCKIVGYEEGTGRLEGVLGSFIIDYKDNRVNVGSGYTDSQRKEFWQHRDEYIDRILEVKFKEESQDKKTGLVSLQFPTFVCIRELGKEISYN